MTYPNSSDVADGQPTSYQQYNRLRKDALFYGNPEADAAPGGKLLARYVEGLALQLLDTDRVRVPASGTAPVGLMIGGTPLQAVLNVDLALGRRPSGAACDYYVFAVRTAGSTAFTLDVNTAPAETSATRLIGRFYWDGTQIVPESVRTEAVEALRGQLGLVNGRAAGGRLTLTPGTPVTAADVASSDTVYYTPFRGNRLPLYAPGHGWAAHMFSELAIPLAGKTLKNYDVFLYWDGTQLQSELKEWASNAARGYALALQDGVTVLAGEPWKRLVGAVRSDAAGLTRDTKLKRFVWNCENRAPRPVERKLIANAWTSADTSFHVANFEDCMVEVLIGDADTFLQLFLSAAAKCAGGEYAQITIGDNSTSTPMAGIVGSGIGGSETSNNTAFRATAVAAVNPPIGYHSYYWLEKVGSGTVNFYGTGSAEMGDSGLVGSVWA